MLLPRADCVIVFHQLNYHTEKGSAHKQHVILFEHMAIIASAELPDRSDPDTCHIYKGLDVSCEHSIPELKPGG